MISGKTVNLANKLFIIVVTGEVLVHLDLENSPKVKISSKYKTGLFSISNTATDDPNNSLIRVFKAGDVCICAAGAGMSNAVIFSIRRCYSIVFMGCKQ
jgi:hypothetical protein